MKHRLNIGVAAFLGAAAAACYLTVVGVLWLVRHITIAGLKSTLSFIAFWLLIAVIIRLFWHLGTRARGGGK
jgi:hypothetical protein